MCPVCGWHDETQLHMYQCTHSEAKRMRTRAYHQMKEYLKHHGLPSKIYVPFVNLCESVCNNVSPKRRYPDSVAIRRAVQSQWRLPHEFLLRGYLTNQWLQALINHKRDQAEAGMVHLLLSLLDILFAQVRDFRNGVLHGNDSIVETYERSNLLNELQEWK